MSANDSSEQETTLAGVGGDDVSAGTSLGGVGGEVLREENRDAGLRPVAERGAEVGWGRTADEAGEQAVAGHDGAGQSEKPQAD